MDVVALAFGAVFGVAVGGLAILGLFFYLANRRPR